MRSIHAFAALLALALPLSAQHVRPVTQIDAGTTTGVAFAPSVSSDGNLTAVVYNDGDISGMPGTGTNNVYVITADGRAMTFGAPAPVDNDPGTAAKFTQFDSCWVYGNSIYVVWRDNRNDDAGTTSITENDLFANASHDGGATWMGEVLLDKGYPAGATSRTVRDFAVHVNDNGTGSGGDDHVYVLTSTEGPTGSGNEELYLVSSHDGGATFSAAVPVSALGIGVADVDFIALGSDGMTVHAAWQDNRFGATTFDDIWYQRSTDGGATWQVADVQLNDISGGQGDGEFEMSLAVDPVTGAVAVAWQEERASATNEELQFTISLDSGITWASDVQIGTYGSSVDVDFTPGAMEIVNGEIGVIWNDHRNGPTSGDDDVFISTSSDNGATWSADVELSVNGGGFATFGRPRAGQDCVVATWTSDVFPNTAESAFSRDGGATWNAMSAVNVSANTGDVDFAEIAFNRTYNNAIAVYLSDDSGNNRLFAGGYRPQTLTVPATVTAGQVVSFSVSNWPSVEAGDFFAVLASGGTGSFALPDGRNSGLLSDAILSQTIAMNQSAVMSGPIPGPLTGIISGAGTGSGVNFMFPNTVPPSTTLRMIAVGFDVPPLTLGSITDIESMLVQ
ncbi:MAG: exo-alpha-sialidase [Planctomycetota bacterium]|nr:MAG: exo-alpha-sialidase [Planctomycetota bacterium]